MSKSDEMLKDWIRIVRMGYEYTIKDIKEIIRNAPKHELEGEVFEKEEMRYELSVKQFIIKSIQIGMESRLLGPDEMSAFIFINKWKIIVDNSDERPVIKEKILEYINMLDNEVQKYGAKAIEMQGSKIIREAARSGNSSRVTTPEQELKPGGR